MQRLRPFAYRFLPALRALACKSVATLFLFFAFLLLQTTNLKAQCAMCRASVENNMNNGDSLIGSGLNAGILYLLIMPYLLIGTIAFLWYRHVRKQRQKNLALSSRP
ncbi:hypothetical protein [Hugenholtzia roseola]|uniref:hypothetical protein n=1 Tax=Hugenholtzia roseola TaxID=1002 RepID=UPI00041C2A54|nr:hypothetical protein [Hugenholtzia roseola]